MITQNENEILYHVELSKAMLEGAEYVLYPGDPGRVEGIAKYLDPNAKFLNTHREYTSYLANYNGGKILVCSSGMGGPSVAIGVEELATLGIKNFIRVGTTGGIQEDMNLGDVVITTAAVRLEGTSTHYAPIEYPAVADLYLTMKLKQSAEIANVPHHLGIGATSDTFWPGQERYDNFIGYVPRKFQGSIKEWQALNVLNFEMEAATLFTICSTFKLKAAAVCGIIALRTESEIPDIEAKKRAGDNWKKIIKGFFDIEFKNK